MFQMIRFRTERPAHLCLVLFALFGMIVLLAAPTPAAAQGYCVPVLPARLFVGGLGQVTPGLPNVLRSQPYRGGDSIVLAEIPAGGVFMVVGGPSCYDGMNWWLVSYNGMYGWTPEGSNTGVYWTVPYFVNPPTPTPPPYCPPLTSAPPLGSTGRVTPGLPNRLRATASLSGRYLRSIPANDTFIYVGGPLCADGMNWWQIDYRGTIGWTAAGYANDWIEPAVCPGFTTSRLAAGRAARVSPGLPNNLRVYPTVTSFVQIAIPGGAALSVIEGPVCSEGMAWWRVRYGFYDGWTSEGQGATYWLQPG
ncbi:MAG: hypothetical protein JNL42_16250 [Anaerolineae bacterium]|nr:hypothetical protein [Anaerolineae bacterium]